MMTFLYCLSTEDYNFPKTMNSLCNEDKMWVLGMTHNIAMLSEGNDDDNDNPLISLCVSTCTCVFLCVCVWNCF